MRHVDVVIIGAGISGSILALSFPKTFSVLVLDKKQRQDPQSGFKKPCGGLLAPDAQKTLSALGLSIPNHVLASPQMFSVKTVDFVSKKTRHYQRHYVNVDRHRLDLWLMSQVPQHINLEEGCLVTLIEETKENVHITYLKDEQEETVSCAWCIGADGASSMVRKLCDAPKIRQYLAIQEKYSLNDMKPFLGCFFNQNLTDSYAWINIKDDTLEFGAALPLQDSLKRYEAFKKHIKNISIDLSHPLSKEACLVNSPKRLSEIYLGKGRLLLVGEAAGWISPSSLEGMSYAMDSALNLSEAFKSDNPLRSYYLLSRPLKFKIFLKQLKSIVLFTPWIRRLVMMSGMEAVKMKD
ncbi:MAG: FAD-binding protein [Erysipelothrix sp.]|jgi:flavin-dependent dehydrogenase|nr:FAD-binding protein [Erysipelothrix sp.]